MAKKSSKSSSKKSSGNPIVNFFRVLITGIVVFIAIIISQITGIDLLSVVGVTTPLPPTPIQVTVPSNPASVTTIPVNQGFGAAKGFWQIYFNNPTTGNNFTNGINVPLAQAINSVQATLDIAAFEWNDPTLTQAVVAAKQRGVQVRMVADNEHTVEDEDTTIGQLSNAGIPIVYDQRSAFMHDKFMILDGAVVWTGSMNYTVNDIFRNNNNLMMLRSRRAVETYQAEFNEMFTNKSFGPTSPAGNTASYLQDGVPITILFGPENQVMPAIIAEVQAARSNVRFMAFSFTYEALGNAMLAKAQQGARVEGVFEQRGSETEFSELRPMLCAGLDVRQDGNGFTMHHKVVIVDNTTVITGSFNFSENAVSSNDENLVIIKDPDLVTQFIAEYERVKSRATRPTNLTCN
jgi:phosphatidylserine/phosphatidylglycerophosphate/cardiolipin synthase-like enzyme